MFFFSPYYTVFNFLYSCHIFLIHFFLFSSLRYEWFLILTTTHLISCESATSTPFQIYLCSRIVLFVCRPISLLKYELSKKKDYVLLILYSQSLVNLTVVLKLIVEMVCAVLWREP